MKRVGIAVAVSAALLVLAGCTAPATKAPASSGASQQGSTQATATAAASGTVAVGEPRKSIFIGTLKKTEMFLHVTKVYDPARVQYASLNGEPSQNRFFKPTHDEGKVNRDYPAYDAKTFKFLALPAGTLPPQTYYMFDKNGGTLNPALKSSGYKAVEIMDQGHIKILPNLYVGYYDFAWVPLNVICEYWSGNESMNQELWKQGNDYVVIGASWNGGISLITPASTTDVKQLANTRVGIMNPSFNIEALFAKALSKYGMAPESIGGNVGIETGTPGYVMNDLIAKKLSACFAWGTYGPQLQKVFHYHELINWTQMGYGKAVPYEVLVVRRDILAKHPEIVQKVVQLNYDATKQALTVGDYKQPLATKYDTFKEKFMGQPPTKTAPQLLDFTAEASPVFLKDVVDYMTKAGYFKVPYTYSQLVDHSFYEKVTK